MKKRTSSLPILVLVAVVALVLGSFGTATAGGLTKSQVKKIAKKVVHKEAPSLSVAHATTANTATNATNINGQAASATFLYRLPTQAFSTNKTYNFPGLPNGTYLFTYSVITTGGGSGDYCYVRPTAADTNIEGLAYWGAPAFSSANSSGVVAGTGAAINLHCEGPAAFSMNTPNASSSVTFTRIDTLTNGAATAP